MRLREFLYDEPARPWLVVAWVPGSKGGWHRVRLHESGRWTCDCRGFSYRQRCRHLDLVLAAREYTAEMVEALV